ncbi:hypothetical protein AB0J83_20860 [Actinoplanes sp. NPDC049596]|uniref:hypothetical protein n=1 Tax=unclassified Actinoplanes TaxID=2626549 RepID=UPI00341B743C
MSLPDGGTYVQGSKGHLDMSIGELHMLSTHTLTAMTEELVGALSKINDALNDLQISWAGEAKAEADKLLDRYDVVSTAIFGTAKEPEKGVLNRLVAGLGHAASSYNSHEKVIEAGWTDLRDKFRVLLGGGTLDGGGGGGDSPPITEV